MEFTQIKYFLKVAETQHITRSAKELHVTQPTLTQSIHRLEENLSVPLFVPRGRNIVLTEYGKYLQKKVTPLMEMFDKIPDELATMAKLETETIHMNVLAASSLVIEGIIDYKQHKKDLNFQILQNPQNELFDITITTKLFYQQDFDSTDSYVCAEKIYLAVPNTGKYADMDSVKLSDVKDEGFVSLFGSKQFRYICDQFCKFSGFEPKIIFESDNASDVKNMIAANLGIGFWPEFTWGAIDSNNVKLLEIEEPICQRDIIISYNMNKVDNGNVIDFFQYLIKYIEDRRNI